MSIYDPSGRLGATEARRNYFLKMEEIEKIKAGKKASQKVGIASANLLKILQDYTSPAKLQIGGESIFTEDIVPTGNIFERIGQKLVGPDLSKVKLTKEATEAGYGIGEGGWEIEKGFPPAPRGAVWLKLKMQGVDKRIVWDTSRAK